MSAALYQDIILQHSRSPLHAHRPACVDASAIGDNPMCGDHVEVFVATAADGAIAEVGFEARGCAISIASADMMAGMVAGAAPAQARVLADAFARMVQSGSPDTPTMEPLRPLAEVHAYPSRRRCATLPWQALMAALDAKDADA